jgi:hypothetical protein
MSVSWGNDAIIHLDAKGKPRSVEINGFEIPALVAFKYEAAVNEVDQLTVTFYVKKCETRMDREPDTAT